MPTVELTKDTIVASDMVLVDFWAEWCGPCRSFAPVYEKVSEEYPDVVFGKVDTEAQRELASYFNIRSIPTLMIFRDQIGIFSQARPHFRRAPSRTSSVRHSNWTWTTSAARSPRKMNTPTTTTKATTTPTERLRRRPRSG